jgi:hypothetical protein
MGFYWMKVLKIFFLLLIITPLYLSSQQQNGLLSMMINDVDSLSSNDFITEKKGKYYDSKGNLCDGYYADFYDAEKNNIRIAGRFKKGLPIDVVIGYYKSGVVKFRYFPLKKRYTYKGVKYNYCVYKEYDEKGRYTRLIDDVEGTDSRYRADGSLTSVLYYNRNKSELIYYEEYFTSNKRKTVISDGNKYDYDENERLRRHWVRKSERYNKKYGTMFSTIYFEEFDVMGNVSKHGRFYTDLFEHDQWQHVFPEFPATIDSVPEQDFKEIIYPRLNLKDVYKWDFKNHKTTIIRYELRGGAWSETERKVLPRSK